MEWLALTGGRITPVVSVRGELVPYGAWLAAQARAGPACACGRRCLGSGRTCGSAECVAALRDTDSSASGTRRGLPVSLRSAHANLTLAGPR
jgi:hypothetical protein